MFDSVVEFRGVEYAVFIYVAESGNNLLSGRTSTPIGILTANLLVVQELCIREYAFGDIGIMKTSPITIRLRSDAVQYHVEPLRTVLFSLMTMVTSELELMETHDVITKITEPTDWCDPMSVTLKKVLCALTYVCLTWQLSMRRCVYRE